MSLQEIELIISILNEKPILSHEEQDLVVSLVKERSRILDALYMQRTGSKFIIE